MTTTPEQAPQEAALFRTIREWGITRGDHGVVGGVVEGLGDRVGMARVPARIIVVVAAIVLNGLVLIAYAAGWALLPDRQGNIIAQNFGRGIPNVGALVGIAVLTLFGLGDFKSGPNVNLDGIPWNYSPSTWGVGDVAVLIFAVLVPLLVVGGIVTLIVVLVKRSNASGQGGAAGAPAASSPLASPPTSASAYATPPVAAAPAGTTPASPVSDPDSTPTAGGAAAYTAPPARRYAPAPPAPPRPPRIPGPGRSFYLVSLAWGAIAAAAAVWMDRTDRLAVHPFVAGFVIFVTGLGLVLLAISLSGRKLGFLGFIGITSLIPILIFAGNADSLRTAYAENGGITTNGVDIVDVIDGIEVGPSMAPESVFDPTLAFDGRYSNVYFNGPCYQEVPQEFGSSSVQRLNLADAAVGSIDGTAAPDTSIDITAEVTYLSIPRSANLVLKGESNAQATVVFADEGFMCVFETNDKPYMELSNPDATTINLVVHDDQFANTIVVKEVTS